MSRRQVVGIFGVRSRLRESQFQARCYIALTGDFRTTAPRPSHALQVRFVIQSHTFSSLKVEQLKLTGEGYKPYKGVRGRSIGSVEWRW